MYADRVYLWYQRAPSVDDLISAAHSLMERIPQRTNVFIIVPSCVREDTQELLDEVGKH